MSLKSKLIKVALPLFTLLTLLISPLFLFNTAYAAGETANAHLYIENVTENNINFVDVTVCLQNTGADFNAGNMTLAIEFDTNQLSLEGSDKFTQVYQKGIYSDTDGYSQMELNQPNGQSPSPFTLEIKRGANDGQGLAVPSEKELIGTVRFTQTNATTNDYGIGWFTNPVLSDLYTSNSSNNRISTTFTDPIIGAKCWDEDNDGVKNSEDSDDNNPCIPNNTGSLCGPTDTDNDGVSDADEVVNNTDPNKADTDDDGKNDFEEGTTDTDNDGVIDALESSTIDTDNDGVMDEMDPANNDKCVPDSSDSDCQVQCLAVSISCDEDYADVEINFIQLDNSSENYIIDFSTTAYTNGESGYHVHFYYEGEGNDVKNKMFSGESPYTLEVSSNNNNYTKLCAVVSRPDHSILESTGNCIDLPLVQNDSSSSSSESSSVLSSSSSSSQESSSQESSSSVSSTVSSSISSSSSSSSVSSSQETQDDNDGIPAEIENQAPNSGDANDDGVVDSKQDKVASVVNKQNKYTAFEFNQCDQSPSPNFVRFKNESEIANDTSYNYPFGLGEFEINCSDTVTISLYWHGVDRSKNYIVRKYGKVTATSQPSYYNINASKQFITIDGKDVLKVTYSVTDNVSGDLNNVEGLIYDPIGLAEIVIAPTISAPVTQKRLSTVTTGGPISIAYYTFVAIFGVIVSRYMIKELRR